MRTRTLVLTGILVAGLTSSALVGLILFGGGPVENTVKLTLLDHAGIMIEAEGLRLYIDPINLEENYTTLPADAVLITHDHGDHYQESNVSLVQKDGTVNVFPEVMTDAISTHEGVGVVPGDQLTVGTISITAFYMYTIAPEGFESSHPREMNYTSYIVDINGFTIFHAGDSKNITEYEQLTGTIDVALLPIGPGCQTMYNEEVVDAIDMIQPSYFIPIHTTEFNANLFLYVYEDDIASVCDCETIVLDDSEFRVFEP